MQGGPWRAKNGDMANKQFFEKTTKDDLIKFAENVNRSAKNAKEKLLSHNIGCELFNGEKIDLQNNWFRDELRKISNYRDYVDIDLNEPLTKKEICENIEDFLDGIAVDDEIFLKDRLYAYIDNILEKSEDLGNDLNEIVDQIYKEFEDVDPYNLDISAFEKDYNNGYAEFFGDLPSAILNAALDKLDMCIAAVPEKLENYGISL